MALVGWLNRSTCIAAASLLRERARVVRSVAPLLGIAAAFLFISVSISPSAEPPRPAEYELKAAFLFNFIKFTEWPAEELGKGGDPFIIGVVGTDPFGAALDKIVEGETFHNRPIVARRFPRMEEAAANSHVLFISSSEESHLPAILKLLGRQGVLTVSEIENFAQRGGIISLKKENNRIVFEINLAAAKRARLTMNAQLLKLAKIVKGLP